MKKMKNIGFNEWVEKFNEETKNQVLNIVNDNLQEYNIMCKHEEMEDCMLELDCLEVSELFMLGSYNNDYYCVKYVDTDDRILSILAINIFNGNVKNVLTF